MWTCMLGERVLSCYCLLADMLTETEWNHTDLKDNQYRTDVALLHIGAAYSVLCVCVIREQ